MATYLGKACTKAHLVDGSSLSLRYISNRKCVECVREMHAAHYLRNQDRIRAKAQEWRASNPDRAKEAYAEYYQQNRDKVLSRNKVYRQAHPESRSASERAYRARHRERLREKDRTRRQTQPHKLKEARDKYRHTHRDRIRRAAAARLAASPRLRLDKNISVRVRQSLRAGKGGRSWEGLVGYSLGELIQHIESQFSPDMTWSNYGSYWHIDHIEPLASFAYSTPNDPAFLRAWSLSNLRPLSAVENLKKGAKFIPFPPHQSE